MTQCSAAYVHCSTGVEAAIEEQMGNYFKNLTSLEIGAAFTLCVFSFLVGWYASAEKANRKHEKAQSEYSKAMAAYNVIASAEVVDMISRELYKDAYDRAYLEVKNNVAYFGANTPSAMKSIPKNKLSMMCRNLKDEDRQRIADLCEHAK